MKKFLFLYVSFCVLQPARLFSISCDLQSNFWTPFGNLKECLVSNVTVSNPHESIDLVSNQFTNMNEIKSFHVNLSPLCHYIPFGIEVFFINLEVLAITHSGLRSVTSDDLRPFRHLRGIYFDDNELEILPEDLFTYNSELQEISLNDNHIKHIAAGLFDSLPKLMKLELLRNPCIDKTAATCALLNSLKANLKGACSSSETTVQRPKGEISFASFEAMMNKIVELESKLSNLQLQFKDSMDNICNVCKLH